MKRYFFQLFYKKTCQKNNKHTFQAFNTLGINIKPGRSKFAITVDIARHIFKMDGISGFYRGYWASLSAYVPNSALWWGFYHLYQGNFWSLDYL